MSFSSLVGAHGRDNTWGSIAGPGGSRSWHHRSLTVLRLWRTAVPSNPMWPITNGIVARRRSNTFTEREGKKRKAKQMAK